MLPRHFRPLRTVGIAACSIVACAAHAGELTIADFATEDALVLIGTDRFSNLKAEFDRTGFKTLMDEPEIREWFDTATAEMMPEIRESLEEFGIDLDDLSWPTGAVGAAFWPDFEEPERGNVIVMADFGADAGTMDEILVEALERGADKGAIDLNYEEVDDVTVWEISGEALEAPAADFDDLDAVGVLDELPVGESEELYYARYEDYLLIGSSIDVIEHAINVVDGRHRSSVRNSRQFQDVSARIDRRGLYMMFLPAPLDRLLDALAEKEDAAEQAEFEMARALLQTLGVMSMNGAGLSVSFDTDDAMMEVALALLTDDKSGVFGLFDAPTLRFEPPAFVGADAASVSMVQFNFDRIVPLVNRVLGSLPAEQRAAMQGMDTMFVGMATPLLANLGPEIIISTLFERPFSINSQKQVWAIRVKDADAVTQSLLGIIPMFGMQSRDFQGNQIWSPAPGGMIDPEMFSLGIGFGYMFLGPTNSVENAMRQAGAGDRAPRLVDEETFRRAISSLGDQGTVFSYSNTKQSLEWGEWYMRNIDKIIAEQMQEFGGQNGQMDPEFRDEMIAATRDAIPIWLRTLPPLDVLEDHFGDSTMEARPTPAGFEGRILWLRPAGR